MKIKFLRAFIPAFGIILLAAAIAMDMGMNPFWIQQGLIVLIIATFGSLALAVNRLIDITELTRDVLVGSTMAAYLTGAILSLPHIFPEAKIFLLEGPAVAMAIIIISILYPRSWNGLSKI
ncbi:MAG: hypothetical protein WC788_09605 [Candidatus Paceibacterota bacterium]